MEKDKRRRGPSEHFVAFSFVLFDVYKSTSAFRLVLFHIFENALDVCIKDKLHLILVIRNELTQVL